MDKAFLDAVSKILNEFALSKFSSQILELTGPAQTGLSYRWRLVSTRYKEVTVVLVTKKPFFGKAAADHFEIYGFDNTKRLGPTLDELRTFLAGSELAATG